MKMRCFHEICIWCTQFPIQSSDWSLDFSTCLKRPHIFNFINCSFNVRRCSWITFCRQVPVPRKGAISFMKCPFKEFNIKGMIFVGSWYMYKEFEPLSEWLGVHTSAELAFDDYLYNIYTYYNIHIVDPIVKYTLYIFLPLPPPWCWASPPDLCHQAPPVV